MAIHKTCIICHFNYWLIEHPYFRNGLKCTRWNKHIHNIITQRVVKHISDNKMMLRGSRPSVATELSTIRHDFSLRLLWLTHCGLVTPYGDIDLRQHWFRQWLVAWRHQAITWTNVDLSSFKAFGIHRRALSWEDLKIPSSKTRIKIPFLESHSDRPGVNELMTLDSFLLIARYNSKLPTRVLAGYRDTWSVRWTHPRRLYNA